MSTQNSSVIPVRLGKPLPLFAYFFNGTQTKRVFVTLYRRDGSVIQSGIEATHVGNGQYINNTVLMPNEAEVRAVYSAFESNGTTPSVDTHLRAMDLYKLDTEAISNATLPANALVVSSPVSVQARLQPTDALKIFSSPAVSTIKAVELPTINAKLKETLQLKGISL